MSDKTKVGGLEVSTRLYNFINNEALPGTGVEADKFWTALEDIVNDFAPRNRELLAKREQIQQQIDSWHIKHKDNFDFATYKSFLQEIDYLLPEGEDFSVSTANVDVEITSTAGPQLVVPVMNARFALNAVNARWGSLYDALYGADAIPEDNGAEISSSFNPLRGEQVVEFAKNFLDNTAPLASGSHKTATAYAVVDGGLRITLPDNSHTTLQEAGQFAGYRGDAANPDAVLFVNNAMHFEVQIDRNGMVGKTDAAGVNDILLESALTTIMDCEDSVAAVDAEDKTLIYHNWLGLMKGDLTEEVTKGSKSFTRRMNPDRQYTAADGSELCLPGRSLMFVRNVGHLMTNGAIIDKDGNEIPEGLMDGMVTSMIAMHSLNGQARVTNSRTGSVYIVKPKMHSRRSRLH